MSVGGVALQWGGGTFHGGWPVDFGPYLVDGGGGWHLQRGKSKGLVKPETTGAPI